MKPVLAPRPASGRVFETVRRVRLADADPRGRLRLDALARILQDTGNDDFSDAGLDAGSPWVARSSSVVVDRWPSLGDRLEVATWCGGLGSRWAERRSSLRGRDGATVEVATLWVYLGDGGPTRLPSWFVDTYGEAAGGRSVSSRLRLPAPAPGLTAAPWPLRATDLDVLGHVNNAATWAAVEEVAARLGVVPAGATLEYGAPLERGDDVELQWASNDEGVHLWLVVGGSVRAAAAVTGSS